MVGRGPTWQALQLLHGTFFVSIEVHETQKVFGKVIEETLGLGLDLSEDLDFTIVEVDEECFLGVVKVGEHRDFYLKIN